MRSVTNKATLTLSGGDKSLFTDAHLVNAGSIIHTDNGNLGVYQGAIIERQA